MSKLYDVLSRLDEIASRDEKNNHIPEIPFQQTQRKGSSFLLRIVILSGTLIFLGIVVVGITAWWQDWFELRKGASAPIALNSSALPTDIPIPIPHIPPEKTDEQINSPASAPLAPSPTGNDQIKEWGIDSVVEEQSLPETIFSAESAIIAETKNRIINVHQLVVDDFTTEPQPLQISESTESAPAEGVIEQTAQLSRWLYQAEQHRRIGDWEGAVVLFAKVWQKSNNPDVANNLAASLIQMDRLPEARKILQQALKKTPHDQDLKQNMQLVQQLGHR